MISLPQIESDLTSALKARDSEKTSVLRALKTRVQNEQIKQMKELSESELLAIVQSEVKRRKEAADSFLQGDRKDLAEQEQREAEILVGYLPPQASEAEVVEFVDAIISEYGMTAKDFGKGMGLLKQKFGNTAAGELLAKILKEKLK